MRRWGCKRQQCPSRPNQSIPRCRRSHGPESCPAPLDVGQASQASPNPSSSVCVYTHMGQCNDWVTVAGHCKTSSWLRWTRWSASRCPLPLGETARGSRALHSPVSVWLELGTPIQLSTRRGHVAQGARCRGQWGWVGKKCVLRSRFVAAMWGARDGEAPGQRTTLWVALAIIVTVGLPRVRHQRAVVAQVSDTARARTRART